jgi:hypothetical protein
MNFPCKECGEIFEDLSSLHKHLKSHNILQGDYYVKHFARKNKLDDSLLPYKGFEDYFLNDFRNKAQFNKWCKGASIDELKSYLPILIKRRINRKKYKFSPSTTEIETVTTQILPSIDIIRRCCDSYEEFCKLNNFNILLKDRIIEIKERKNIIAIDTREQKPLRFDDSIVMKLDIGDYTACGENFSNTFIDRKAISDFIGTVTNGFNRFCKELDRAVKMNAYVFIMVECSIPKIYAYNNISPHKANLEYVFSQMNKIQHMFPKNCQFVFCDGRKNCEKTLINILNGGKSLWSVDVQNLINKGLI